MFMYFLCPQLRLQKRIIMLITLHMWPSEEKKQIFLCPICHIRNILNVEKQSTSSRKAFK